MPWLSRRGAARGRSPTGVEEAVSSALVEDSLEELDVRVELGVEVEAGFVPEPVAEVLVCRIGLLEVRHEALVARHIGELEHLERDVPVDLERRRTARLPRRDRREEVVTLT